MTKLNQSILNIIDSKGHLTAEEVFLLAKKKKIDVSLASVYRILDKLSKDGLIKRIGVSNGKDIFDKTTSDHEHIICEKCGKIVDVHIKDFKKILIKETGIKDIKTYNLCIKYICDECKKR